MVRNLIDTVRAHNLEAGRVECKQQTGVPDLRGGEADRAAAPAQTAGMRTDAGTAVAAQSPERELDDGA